MAEILTECVSGSNPQSFVWSEQTFTWATFWQRVDTDQWGSALCWLRPFCVCASYFFQVYDLSSPAESENSAPGCALTDGVCLTAGGPSCGVHGKCLGEWGSFSCDCQPGYSGHKCDKGKPTQYVSLHGLYLMTVTVIIYHNNNTIIPHLCKVMCSKTFHWP